MEVITHILSKNFGHNHLLAYVDKYGNSPIANVLLSKDEKMLEMSRDYIARNATGHGSDVSLKQELKPPCVGDNLTNILNAVHWPQFVDLARKDMLEHYLYPVYEETSLEQVRELIGSLED